MLRNCRRRWLAIAAALLSAALLPATADRSAAASPEEVAAADSAWPGLVTDVFDGRPMQDGAGIITLEAPARAADPALVPVTLTLDPAKAIRKVTLVIDENPSPVAATFTIGEKAGLTQLSTRVRVNAYTDIHAVAEAADGTLYMVKRFVKAAGGCAAPAGKDPELAAREMGQMKLRRFPPDAANGGRSEAQLMIRHPNNSGLQKDQVTLLYIPAHFITDLTVSRDGQPVFTMSGGISISEDPSFRFDYAADGGPGTFAAMARDTEGKVWEKTFTQGDS
ncbi:quinoprotein dehydrogenase-associated SoxYZ-like carrier [Mangrovicella endophytica]|uniref:quinoprotein dehydrogenase-associated SoxYZ-like carrier n=1 Tax=Mangrovicella endophytica TaxID=2066697 RepID=UPI000C9E7064|nr:quinoprotein dehydrogenase-associated SoxYZ-like carrier [Mangrovicella endophytica]